MNTPRTDLESQLTVISCEDSCIETYVYREGDLYSGDIVTADFARQLEAELQAMTALADRLAEELRYALHPEYLFALKRDEDSEMSLVYSAHQNFESALAAYESHKKQTP